MIVTIIAIFLIQLKFIFKYKVVICITDIWGEKNNGESLSGAGTAYHSGPPEFTPGF